MGNDLKTYWLVSEKLWHENLFHALTQEISGNWYWCKSKEEFSLNNLEQQRPDIIFIPHWSYIIPKSIYSKFECIVFHMTDLPYGRGGSPLQNLIVTGKTETKISAIKAERGIDTGPIYLKEHLSLEGTAQQIFERSTIIIEKMIKYIIEFNPKPDEQEGEIVEFKRRKREEGNILQLETIEQIYDYIRMLDCEGYPNAYLETPHFIFEFSKAELKPNTEINAHVRITKK
jgi:methionyl-tRNA formyltransferase